MRVEAVSAEVTPLQTFPPIVATLRSWGPPIVSAASAKTGKWLPIRGFLAMWDILVIAPIQMAPSPFNSTPFNSSSF
jgi:hypothetical protein